MAQHNDEIYEFQQHHLYGNSEPNEYWPVVTTVACPNGRWRVRYEDGSHGVVDPNRLWPAPYKKRKAGEPLIPAHNVYNYCAVIDNPELYSKSGLEKKAHPNYLESRAYEFNERACAKILKSCVGDDAYDGSQRQKQLSPPRCVECGREGVETRLCMCANEGSGLGLLGQLATSALRKLFPDGILPGEAGYPEVANCELLTGASTVKFLMDVLRAMTGLGSSELDAMLSRTVAMRIRKTTANLDKGTTISRDIVDDLLDYNTCFYAPSELAKPDVLDRTYRASRTSKRVTAWGRSATSAGGWYGIGDPNAPRQRATASRNCCNLKRGCCLPKSEAARLRLPRWTMAALGAYKVKGKKGTICRAGVETDTAEVCVLKKDARVVAVAEALNAKGDVRLRLQRPVRGWRSYFDSMGALSPPANPSGFKKPLIGPRCGDALPPADSLPPSTPARYRAAAVVCGAGAPACFVDGLIADDDPVYASVWKDRGLPRPSSAIVDFRAEIKLPHRQDETYRVEAVCRLPEKGDEDDDDDDDLGKAVLFSDTGMKQRMKIHPNAKDVDFFCFGSASILAADGVTKMAVAKCRAVRGSMLRHYAAADFRYAARFVVDGPVACPTFATGLEDLPSQPPPTMVVAGPQKDQIPVDPKVFVDYPMSVGRYQERALVAGDPRKTSLYPPGDEKLAKYEADGAFQPWLKHLYDPWTGDMRAMPFGWTSGPEAASMRGVDLRYFYDESKRELVGTVRFSENALEAVFDGSKGLYAVDCVHPGALHAVMDETTAELMKLDDDVCKGGDSLVTECVGGIYDADGALCENHRSAWRGSPSPRPKSHGQLHYIWTI
ncbi:hypothetical protein JL720_13964 [Aureococcus anophagefferens]|nr:hypothetical protein JL720_13964 [Aureococcus anophagefferens]